MKKTMVYLPDEQRSQIDEFRRLHHMSIAGVIREALSEYFKHQKPSENNFQSFVREASGIWKDRKDIKSGLAYQRYWRKRWGRKIKSLGR